tara:strand:- start:2695 stop:3207 length:513 start_codon:yes stop_codon:yes gene_type:complete
MAKDYLNVVERALMMGISDKINGATASGSDVYVFGQFPETEDLKFPAVVVQMVASGFDEEFFGQDVTFGSSGTAGTGEVYGVTYLVHILLEKETEITIGSDAYKQRRLLNWLMLNIANAVADINWSVYEEEELEILDRRLQSWRDVGYLTEFQWYGATAEFLIHFKNFRT